MIACVALLLAASSWSVDEATRHLREGDVVLAAEALERAVQLDPSDREAVLLLGALYDELGDKERGKRLAKLREGLEPVAPLTALARAGVETARRTKRPLQRLQAPAQWAQLVKLGPDDDPGPPGPPLLAAGYGVETTRCEERTDCSETQRTCCLQTSSGLQTKCIPEEGACELKPRGARGACFTSYRPDYCNVDAQPDVTLRALRCGAAPEDAVVVQRVLRSAALAAVAKAYGRTWPRTLPLAKPAAKVVAHADADGDGAEDTLVEVELRGSRQDPQFSEYTLSPDPERCKRVFVVSGERVTLAGNTECAENVVQLLRGFAVSKRAQAPILFMETSVNGASGAEALTWDGAEYVRVWWGCGGNG